MGFNYISFGLGNLKLCQTAIETKNLEGKKKLSEAMLMGLSGGWFNQILTGQSRFLGRTGFWVESDRFTFPVTIQPVEPAGSGWVSQH